MNTLPRHRRVLVLKCLVEGMSIRSVSRITDVSRNTVTKLLIDAGKACSAYQHRTLRDLPCKRIQVGEIWSFVHAKRKNVPRSVAAPPLAGDVWTWTAICADTKLVPSWRIGDRTSATALEFLDDLYGRLIQRVQLTSDGHSAYLDTVGEAFGPDVDYAQLVKLYGKPPHAEGENRKYSPPKCIGARRKVIEGKPDSAHISTSYVERQNLTMRMSMRRFTRLTNAFSKEVENHAHAVALHFMYYNFCRIHQTLKITPAMEAGVTRKLWEIGDIVDLVEANAPKPKRPDTYRKHRTNSN